MSCLRRRTMLKVHRMKYKSVTEHPIWTEMVEFIVLGESKAQSRWRINVSDRISLKLATKAKKVQVKCSADNCKRLIHPFRGVQSKWGLYYASSCDQKTSLTCSRSGGAKKECASVQLAVNAYRNKDGEDWTVAMLNKKISTLDPKTRLMLAIPHSDTLERVTQVEIFHATDKGIVCDSDDTEYGQARPYLTFRSE